MHQQLLKGLLDALLACVPLFIAILLSANLLLGPSGVDAASAVDGQQLRDRERQLVSQGPNNADRIEAPLVAVADKMIRSDESLRLINKLG